MEIKKLCNSFKFAGLGLKTVIRNEQNMRIHLTIAFLVLVFGILFKVSRVELCVLLLAIGFVLTAELFNSCIETIVNLISPEQNKLAGQAKDIAAGAVLCSAIVSIFIGVCIFGPKLVYLLQK